MRPHKPPKIESLAVTNRLNAKENTGANIGIVVRSESGREVSLVIGCEIYVVDGRLLIKAIKNALNT